MMKLNCKLRLLLGILAILVSLLLSWGLWGWLGNFSLLALVPGGFLFIWLNPELMGGG
ncbi:MAG: hypothetical protein RSE09_02245 [Oscillospiraceae bacterium]